MAKEWPWYNGSNVGRVQTSVIMMIFDSNAVNCMRIKKILSLNKKENKDSISFSANKVRRNCHLLLTVVGWLS